MIRELLDRFFPHDTLMIGGQPYMRRWYVFGYAPGDPNDMICATCGQRVLLWHLLDDTVDEWAHFDQRPQHDVVPVSRPRDGWRWQDHGIGAVRIHCIFTSDDSRAYHDHPWPLASLVLRGAYDEERPRRIATRGGQVSYCPEPGRSEADVRGFRAPALNVKKATDLHVLRVVKGPVWSLFFTRPKVRSWGFAGPFGWIGWRDFDERFPERDAWTEVGA